MGLCESYTLRVLGDTTIDTCRVKACRVGELEDLGVDLNGEFAGWRHDDCSSRGATGV